MIQMGKRLAAQVQHFGATTAFYLVDFGNDGKRRDAKIEYEEIAEGMYADPSFTLSMEIAQEMFEQMWAQGFRSKHDRGGSDKLDAARSEHIADLRKAAKLT